MAELRVTFRVQHALALFHREEDDGKFVAVACRRGFEGLLGRKVKPGEVITGKLVFVPDEAGKK